MGFVYRAFVAAGVGVAASAIVGCGSGRGSWLSASQSNQLSEQLNRVTQALDDQQCTLADQYLAEFRSRVDGLGGVNATLVANLDRGAVTIRSLADRTCRPVATTPKRTRPRTTTTPATTTTQTVATFTTPSTPTYSQPSYTQPPTDTSASTSTTGGVCPSCAATTTTAAPPAASTPSGGTGLGGAGLGATTGTDATTTGAGGGF